MGKQKYLQRCQREFIGENCRAVWAATIYSHTSINT